MQRYEFAELMPRPRHGRVFTQRRQPFMADCAPSGRVRLDALARWAQDIAYADAEDAGLAKSALWVIRRSRLRVRRFPRFGERFELATFCSGIGRMWAERRTSFGRIVDGGVEDEVEFATLWVHLDPEHARPIPLTDRELATWAQTADGRRVTARLRHPGPDGSVEHERWRFRATDCDLAGHVNNAAYLLPLEEELLQEGDPDRLDLEIEYRSPSQPGEKLVLRNGDCRWIVSPGGETHASLVVRRSETCALS